MSETPQRKSLDGHSFELGLSHTGLIDQAVRLMDVGSRDRILHIGCGEGRITRTLADLAKEGSVIGLDVSNEMIHRAREQSSSIENVLYLWAGMDQIPWQENFFTKVLCTDALYDENTERVLREIHRVLAPGGFLWIVNALSRENELSQRWIDEAAIQVQLPSAKEYETLLRRCGYEGVSHRMLSAPRVPGTPSPAPFRDTAELRRFYELGALLLAANKPSEPRP
jgi:ubiquinone/menaquinone biosynthesis C-methylase UbiE